MADRRDAMDGREPPPTDYRQHPGALRVAPAGDPTVTRWIHLGADLDQARDTAARACHTDPDHLLNVAAAGYGRYGLHRHRLHLPILCTIHQVADTHRVALRTVGDWLDAEGATTRNPSPGDIQAQFAAAYIGPFTNQTAYTRHRMTQLGWTDALTTAGIPERYLNLSSITLAWFSDDVRAVHADTHDHIEVFHRHQP